MTIAQVVQVTPSLSTLSTALKSANLVDALNGPGPFTLFAPDNNAFNALPAGTLQNLMLPANMKKLTAILTYHVLSGKYGSKMLKSGQMQTLAGQMVQINVSSKGVMVNNAQVTQADIMASNGVIHVINAVLIPPLAN